MFSGEREVSWTLAKGLLRSALRLTIMGVGALDPVRDPFAPSTKTVSRKAEADRIDASEASLLLTEPSMAEKERNWSMLEPMDRKMTSRASCVSPR